MYTHPLNLNIGLLCSEVVDCFRLINKTTTKHDHNMILTQWRNKDLNIILLINLML